MGTLLARVERRSRSIVRDRCDSSLEVSASCLGRLETAGHELIVNTLIALAEVYSIPIEQLLRSNYPGNAEPLTIEQLFRPSAITLPMEGSQTSQANNLASDTPFPDQSPDEATLLPKKNVPFPTPLELYA
jgi:hypothetical protein